MADVNQTGGNGGKGGTIGAIFLIVIFLVLGMASCSGGGSCVGKSHSTNTCEACGRSWEAGDSGGNYMNITRTGMCKNCYNNYKWVQEQLGR